MIEQEHQQSHSTPELQLPDIVNDSYQKIKDELEHLRELAADYLVQIAWLSTTTTDFTVSAHLLLSAREQRLIVQACAEIAQVLSFSLTNLVNLQNATLWQVENFYKRYLFEKKDTSFTWVQTTELLAQVEQQLADPQVLNLLSQELEKLQALIDQSLQQRRRQIINQFASECALESLSEPRTQDVIKQYFPSRIRKNYTVEQLYDELEEHSTEELLERLPWLWSLKEHYAEILSDTFSSLERRQTPYLSTTAHFMYALDSEYTQATAGLSDMELMESYEYIDALCQVFETLIEEVAITTAVQVSIFILQRQQSATARFDTKLWSTAFSADA